MVAVSLSQYRCWKNSHKNGICLVLQQKHIKKMPSKVLAGINYKGITLFRTNDKRPIAQVCLKFNESHPLQNLMTLYRS